MPGVQLTNEGDNRKGVSIRGLDSSYTLILVDGKRVNSRNAVFRHNDFDLNWIPVDSIERIEVAITKSISTVCWRLTWWMWKLSGKPISA